MDAHTAITCILSCMATAFISHLVGFRQGYRKGHFMGWIDYGRQLEAEVKHKFPKR